MNQMARKKLRSTVSTGASTGASTGSSWRLQISSGVGPAEVQRFVALLADWMERLCARRGLSVISVEVVEAPASAKEEPGLRSATLLLQGDADSALAGEVGTHELVARSVTQGRRGRKRWYVGVTLSPAEAPGSRSASGAAPRQTSDLAAEVDVETFRSGGPGGQHVNRRETGVRVRHRETGIAVRVTQERSQKMNLRLALSTLIETLDRRQAERNAHDAATRRLRHYRVERGNPVRSYALNHQGALQHKESRNPCP